MDTKIANLIAAYTEPNPIIYCSHATVSKCFYSAFTSDDVWRQLNPYNVDRYIFKHFMDKTLAADKKKMKLYWERRTRTEPASANWYCWLGFLVRIASKHPSNGFKLRHQVTERELLLVAVRLNGHALKWGSSTLRADLELVGDAVSNQGCALEWADSRLQDNEEIVQKAIKRGCRCLAPRPRDSCRPIKHASLRLRSNPSIITVAMSHGNFHALRNASESLKQAHNFIMEVVKRHGNALQYATELKDDRSIVLAAVENDGSALRYASRRLQRDRLLVLVAVSRSGKALAFTAKKLRKDDEIVATAIKNYGEALENAPNHQDNEDYVTIAVEQNYRAFLHASDRLKKDADFVAKMIKIDGRTISMAHYDLEHNRDFVLQAVTQNGQALEYIREFHTDREIVYLAAKTYPQAIELLPMRSRMKNNDRAKTDRHLSKWESKSNNINRKRHRPM